MRRPRSAPSRGFSDSPIVPPVIPTIERLSVALVAGSAAALALFVGLRGLGHAALDRRRARPGDRRGRRLRARPPAAGGSRRDPACPSLVVRRLAAGRAARARADGANVGLHARSGAEAALALSGRPLVRRALLPHRLHRGGALRHRGRRQHLRPRALSRSQDGRLQRRRLPLPAFLPHAPDRPPHAGRGRLRASADALVRDLRPGPAAGDGRRGCGSRAAGSVAGDRRGAGGVALGTGAARLPDVERPVADDLGFGAGMGRLPALPAVGWGAPRPRHRVEDLPGNPGTRSAPAPALEGGRLDRRLRAPLLRRDLRRRRAAAVPRLLRVRVAAAVERRGVRAPVLARLRGGAQHVAVRSRAQAREARPPRHGHGDREAVLW